MLKDDDALHASYSRYLAQGGTIKGLIKFAKDKGLGSPEVWSHNGGYALRYVGSDGETKQLSLGAKFSDARRMILSLAGKPKPKVKLAVTQHDDKGVGKRLQQFADSAGFENAQVRFIGKQYVLFYSGKQLPLGPAGRALTELRRLAGVLLSLSAKPKAKVKLADNSMAGEIAKLKKKYPKFTFTVDPSGKIKGRSDTAIVVGKDANEVMKKIGAKLSLSVYKAGDMWNGKEIIQVLPDGGLQVKSKSGAVQLVRAADVNKTKTKTDYSAVASWVKSKAGTTKIPMSEFKALAKQAEAKFGSGIDLTELAAALLKLR